MEESFKTTSKENEALNLVIETTRSRYSSKSKKVLKKAVQEDSVFVAALINSLFTVPVSLQKAWKIVGFPFAVLNDLYKKITGHNHPEYEAGFGDYNY